MSAARSIELHQHHRELGEHGWLTVEEASKLLKKSKQTLANWRSQGKGPKYTKNGNEVLYRPEWIEEYKFAGVVEPRQQKDVKTSASEVSSRKSKTSPGNHKTATKPGGRTRKFGGHQTKRKKLEAARGAF